MTYQSTIECLQIYGWLSHTLTSATNGLTMYVRTKKAENMDTTIKTTIIGIGNSRGIRIPKVLLEQTGMTEQVEISAQSSQLIIRPVVKTTRQGWEEKFQEMAKNGDDALLDETVSTSQWDEEGWQW